MSWPLSVVYGLEISSKAERQYFRADNSMQTKLNWLWLKQREAPASNVPPSSPILTFVCDH